MVVFHKFNDTVTNSAAALRSKQSTYRLQARLSVGKYSILSAHQSSYAHTVVGENPTGSVSTTTTGPKLQMAMDPPSLLQKS
ncbi:hypothetical protein BV898_16115 [Hypsibius exemplaris]|uniref:Uncharacterized protein n=1 Tax=Hypsibius exemplaris TaxID=2072580 RepID=A0A9X6NLD5_HYPEX|nr:hypothetical protein BV898_16115 [Hypsibius exemplaris]